jgi:cysteinyl-tRNA synthetase
MAARERARAERDFEQADRIRDELASRGYEVRDTPDGPRLVRHAG